MTVHPFAQARLSSQLLVGGAARTPGEVVAALGALQAQDYAQALWAVGVRLPGATEAQVEQALAGRMIVRTWPLRGTLHFVAAADVRWMLDLLASAVIAGSARRRRQLELDDTTLARSREVIMQALAGGQRTREELMAQLEGAQIATGGQRAYHILWQLALAGVICFGVPQGKQQTFVLLEEWVPQAKRMDRDEALAELARRYFSSHGPAGVQDFVWWSGLKVGDARRAVELASPHLAHADLDGTRYWMAPTSPVDPEPSPHALLLPGFDEYMLGYRDRSAVLDPDHAGRIVPGGNGVFRPILVINGQIAGTWKRTLKKDRVLVEIHPFDGLGAAEARAATAAAIPYGHFLHKVPDVAFVANTHEKRTDS